MFERVTFGFYNPNHAAAMICAVMPFCWDWRQARWIGRALSAALVVVLMATQSRMGLLVAGAEAVVWWISRRGTAHPECAPYRRWGPWIALALAGAALWWMWPRLMLDDSILNRPRIWLAGLRLGRGQVRRAKLG